MNTKKTIIITIFIILLLVLGYVSYQYYLLVSEVERANKEFNISYELFEDRINNLNAELDDVRSNNSFLVEALQSEQEINDEFEDRIRDIIGTVSDLERLNELDRELLQKYSRVYFLNEHYVPSELINISSKYLYFPEREQEIHAEVWPHLEDMIVDAQIEGEDIFVVSGFRSFGTQIGLKRSYVVTYGAGTANQFSAEQGYSEHQLGTTVDFTVDELDGGLDGFETTTAYKWLLNNAHRYGFTLSYPEGNNYYQFEPWHWRFVGIDLATHLHNEGISFYDMEQREIDKYLIRIFD